MVEKSLPCWAFRELNADEERQFRRWAREHKDELKFQEISIYHPVIRDEMAKMIQESLDQCSKEMKSPFQG